MISGIDSRSGGPAVQAIAFEHFFANTISQTGIFRCVICLSAALMCIRLMSLMFCCCVFTSVPSLSLCCFVSPLLHRVLRDEFELWINV